MSVTERVMAAGSWQIELAPDTPRRLMEAIDVETRGFSQLVILPTRLAYGAASDYVVRSHTDATLLGLARWSGIYRAQEGHTLSGPGSGILLGDEDGKGDVFEVERSTANGYLTQWVPAIRPMALNAGTTYSPGGSYRGTFHLVTAKEALETLRETFDVEWVVRPNFNLDVGSPTNLYGGATPKLIILSDAGDGGRDMTLTGVRGVSGMLRDLEDYTTKVVYVTEQTTETTQSDIATTADDATVSGSTSVTETSTETIFTTAEVASTPYARPSDGGPVILDRIVRGGSEDGSDEDPQTMADAELAKTEGVRREITVEGGRFELGHLAPVGAYVWLYAPPVLMDAANPVHFRGRTTYPIKVRLMGCTWPITRGLGVYLRTTKDGVTWRDLTDYVVWESGDVRLEVAALPRPAVSVVDTSNRRRRH